MLKSFFKNYPWFKNIKLNERGPICKTELLKKWFVYTPLFVPGNDTTILNNTFFTDSLLSVLAFAVVKYKHNYQFLLNTINKTASFY